MLTELLNISWKVWCYNFTGNVNEVTYVSGVDELVLDVSGTNMLLNMSGK